MDPDIIWSASIEGVYFELLNSGDDYNTEMVKIIDAYGNTSMIEHNTFGQLVTAYDTREEDTTSQNIEEEVTK